MIQRKQTIWLLLAIVSMVLMAFIPFGHQATLAPTATAVTTIDLTIKYNFILIVLTAVSITAACFAIFLFKNRPLQKLLCITILLLSTTTTIYEFFTANNKAQNFVLSFGIALPIIASLLAILAWNGIYADEKLLKSVDRLRD
jgi:peptidoglycan/LPS O-acetylase OafA/YrhL